MTIKVCIRPGCEAIYHNVQKGVTICENCDMRLVRINTETYRKKFIDQPHQYDLSVDAFELTTPEQQGFKLQSQYQSDLFT